MVERFDPPRDVDWKLLPMRPDIAGQYVRYSDLAAARAEIERLNNALTEAANQIGDLATRLGQAEGRLDASELVGVVEGWKARAEKAEAERDEARAQVAAAFEYAAKLCDDTAQEALDESGTCSRILWTWFCGQSSAIRAIDPAKVLAKVPPAPAVPDDVAKLWQDTADNDDFCALFGLIPLRDTATGEAIMWQEKSSDFIDFAVALRDALETQADAVARLVKAVKNERHHKSAYDATPTDRRGYNGPKGQAYILWCEARADVGTALEAIEASPCPAAGGAESV